MSCACGGQPIAQCGDCNELICATCREVFQSHVCFIGAAVELTNDINELVKAYKAYQNTDKASDLAEVRRLAEVIVRKARTPGGNVIFLQDFSQAWPDLELLSRYKSFTVTKTIEETEGKNVFYVLNHTARLETVNLDKAKLNLVKENAEKVVVLAISRTGEQTVERMLSDGTPVIQLFYTSKQWVDEKNQSAYKRIEDAF